MAQKSIRLQVAFVLALFCLSISPAANSQEVIVLGGVENVMQWLKSEDWWGEENRSAQPKIPNVIITGINPSWRTTSQTLPVQQKKEVFYRLMVPLIVHANGMVIERRGRLLEMKAALAGVHWAQRTPGRRTLPSRVGRRVPLG